MVAGSIVERVEGDDKLRNTSVLVGPDGAHARAPTARSTCSTSKWAASTYRESDAEAPGDEVVVADVGGVELGWPSATTCAFRSCFASWPCAARARSLPAAFTVPTGRAHWEVLVRARAIENQAVHDRGRPDRANIRPITKATGIR